MRCSVFWQVIESQLIITIDALAKSLAKGEQIDVILLDFSKAFDKVPHHRLLHKVSMFQRSKWSIIWL
jgi:hypothetical protein